MIRIYISEVQASRFEDYNHYSSYLGAAHAKCLEGLENQSYSKVWIN